MGRYIPKALRDRVAVQSRHRCGYCLASEQIIGMPMEIDLRYPVPDDTPQKPKASITFDPALAGKNAQLTGKNFPNPDAVHVIDNQPWLVPLDPFFYRLEVTGSNLPKKLFEIDGSVEVVNVTFP